MTPEAKVKAAVKKVLNKRGVYYFMPATSGYGRSGVPDFICCYKKRFVGIECKAGAGKLTALQAREIERISNCGGITFVIHEETLYGLEDMLEMLTEK